ncbi:MAG: type II toxin-antitoxin system PemK/MazF family toxin [Chloroflexota bacterium]|nr:type II toxin-antitoxin system PemK/MazF family toxin [Chloroflexota bacterium]
MTKYKVVLVPFPFDDLSSSKVRPAVCLTEPIGQYRHVVLAFITSRIPEEILATDILIATDDEDFETSGLRVSSTLRLHRMMTATVNIIQRELGQLPETKQEIVKSRLRALFDLQ